MSNYDGPSIFKKDKNERYTSNKTNQKEAVGNLFEPAHRKKLPTSIRTQTDIQQEAKRHMAARSTHKKQPTTKRFQSKYIPPSMSKYKQGDEESLEVNLRAEISKRLKKEKTSYLLFEDELHSNTEGKIKQNHTESKKSKSQIKAVDKNTKGFNKNLNASPGLRRSLSNIIEEDQATLKNREQKLDSLFSEKNQR